MMSIQFSVVVCSFLCAGVAGVEAKDVSQQVETPLGKVLSVIQKIRREVLKEEIAEETVYKNFACFCKDKTARLEKMVHHSASKIDLSSANIGDWTAESNERESDNQARRSNHEKMSAQVDESDRRLTEENTNWQNIEAEFNSNKHLISQALKAMKDSKSSSGKYKGPDSFLQTPGIAQYVAMADAMGLITAPKQKALAASLMQGVTHPNGTGALLQGAARVNGTHTNPMESYNYHGGSDDVINLVESLMKDMQTLRNTQQDEHVKAKAAFERMIQVTHRKMSYNRRDIRGNTRALAGLKTQTAQARQDLIESRADLDETDHVLKEVSSACTSRADEYDKRTAARNAELTALTTALACLGRAQPAADRVRLGQGGHLLLQAKPISQTKSLPKPNHTQTTEAKAKAPEKAVAKPPSFLQEQSRRASFLSRAELSLDERKKRALDVILSEGQRVNSLMLTSLASRAEHDPFAKVKQLLSDLRFRLESEASQETTKKVWCDEELSKTKHEMVTRFDGTKHIAMLINRLDAQSDALKENIKFNTNKALEIGKSIKIVFTDASQLNKEQLRQFKEQKEARDELHDAIRIIKTYYSQAAKEADRALLQVDGPPDQSAEYRAERKVIQAKNAERAERHAVRVEEREERERKRIGELDGDVPASGRLGTMGDALALLETVASDFDREIGNLEGDMSEEYKQLHATNEILKAQKVSTEELVELDTQELNTNKVNTAAKFEDLQTTQTLLDNALTEMEGLKPSCIDTGMSYKDRVAARKTEMAALTNALCILGETDKEKYGCK